MSPRDRSRIFTGSAYPYWTGRAVQCTRSFVVGRQVGVGKRASESTSPRTRLDAGAYSDRRRNGKGPRFVDGCLLPFPFALALRTPRCVSALFRRTSARHISLGTLGQVISRRRYEPARERNGTYDLCNVLISMSPGRKRMRALATRHRRRNSSGSADAYTADMQVVQVSRRKTLSQPRDLSHVLCARRSPPVAAERARNAQICYLQHPIISCRPRREQLQYLLTRVRFEWAGTVFDFA